MFYKGDFHIHSTASDGDLTPTEIVRLASDEHMDIISITDHNTILGIDEAVKSGAKFGVTVIPGVELSTRHKNKSVHILGYFKDDRYKDKNFERFLRLVKNHKARDAKHLINLNSGINKSNYRLSVYEGIRALKLFGAIVVLAHPILINKNCLTEIINMPFDGIEAKHFRHTPSDIEFFIKIAVESGLFYTAGSDFHTNKQTNLKHGLIGDIYLNSREIDKFLKILF
ncbi:PHP domain-containing protein [Clostridium peptidivorans]|uniref:PHP domain-containing protein n=1 Tax=Clostridium peptidivorans TaxID=100174 RepID=UPI000BE38B90|nr:PHP domain-containing protein [Clostridium peptidivorans]